MEDPRFRDLVLSSCGRNTSKDPFILWPKAEHGEAAKLVCCSSSGLGQGMGLVLQAYGKPSTKIFGDDA